jgi:hypothetical protein
VRLIAPTLTCPGQEGHDSAQRGQPIYPSKGTTPVGMAPCLWPPLGGDYPSDSDRSSTVPTVLFVRPFVRTRPAELLTSNS